MANEKTSKYLGILIFSMFVTALCESNRDRMYKHVSGAFCFKRLNAFKEFGCTTSRSGETGVLHIIRNETDMTWLIKDANAGPYVVVLTFDYFNRETLLMLKNSRKVSGIVLKYLNETSTPKYSPDDRCPNRYSGLDNQCDNNNPWNPSGDSLLFINFGFPIIYIDSKEALDFIDQCYDTYNAHDKDKQSSRSLCAIEIATHMFAAVDTKTCIRRTMMFNNLVRIRYCDPLGDWSIYLPLLPRIKPEAERSVILVIARLDGFSMFDGMVPGARSPVLGIVSLLTTAYYLSKMTKARDHIGSEKNVMFMLLNGESFDYIGSSRIIYEMKNNSFPYKLQTDDPNVKQSPPLKLEHIGLIIELDDITNFPVFHHSKFNSNATNSMANKFLQELDQELKEMDLVLSESVKQLPPSSVQRFLRDDPNIDGIILSSYNATFTNEYYHSILDTHDKLDSNTPSAIAQLALFLAKSLYRLLFNTMDNTVKIDVQLVHDLLECYLVNSSCHIFQRITFNQKLPEKPFSLYVGVHNHNNTITNLTGLTLAMLTGEENHNFNQSMCQKDDNDWIYQRFWMSDETDTNKGVCIVSQVNYTLALSPAFEIEGYDWMSGQYSSWSESLWQEISVRIFLKPSKHHEITTLSLGLVVLIFFFVIVYFVNTKAHVLFNHQVLGSGGC